MGFMDMLGGLLGGGGGDPAGGAVGGTPPITGEGGPGTGGGDMMSSILPLLIGGGGALASILGGGPPKKATQAENRARDISAQGEEMVKRAAAGQLTAPQQATVDKYKAEETAKWRQYMAQLGIPVSSSEVQGQGVVDAQAQKMANDMINQSFTQGMEALRLGSTVAQQQITQALSAQKDMSKTIWDVAGEIGRVLNTPTNKTQVPGAAPSSGNVDVPVDWSTYGPQEGDPYAGTIPPDVSYT